MSNGERIQKILAQQGYGSRREIERWIVAGRIKINHRCAVLGDCVTETDKLTIDSKPIVIELSAEHTTDILLYNKPSGEVCARKDNKFRTVYENLPPCRQGRWVIVGRLDVSTSGLLLFTNNGQLANNFMHPKYQVSRKYLVRVHGSITPKKIHCLCAGVKLSDGLAKFEQIKLTSKSKTNQWCQVVLTEGRNREVKRLFESQGCTVTRLIRIGFGKIHLPKNLRPAEWQYFGINLKKQVFSELR